MKMNYFKFLKDMVLMVFAFFILMSCTKKGETAVLSKKIESENSILNDKEFTKKLSNVPIHVIAPASGISKDVFDSLKNQEVLNLLIPRNLISQIIPYNSNTDENRFEQLKNALSDNTSIIWSLRGGYGSARLYDSLSKLKKPTEEKVFIGYSDLTFIHLFLNQKWGWKTIHGAMILDLFDPKKDPKNFSMILDILSGKERELKYLGIKPFNSLANSIENVQGILVGGNLELLENSLGTPWQIIGKNKIIFIEDVGVKGYSVDRTLNHLKQANVFKEAKAVLFGSFIGSDNYVDFALERFAKNIDIPVYKADIFGHGNTNYPLVFNTKAIIHSQDQSITLEVGEEFKNALIPKVNNSFAIR